MSSDFKTENKPNEQVSVKKSKKKKYAILGIIFVVSIISIIVMNYYILPFKEINIGTPNQIRPTDFPLEKFAQGYDELCQRDLNGVLACVIKDDGKIELTNQNGIFKFQTKDYSLLKYFSDESGYEEKSISSAFYEHQVTVKNYNYNGQNIWLITAKGMQ